MKRLLKHMAGLIDAKLPSGLYEPLELLFIRLLTWISSVWRIAIRHLARGAPLS
jgi:hypothetical protein